MRPSGHFRGRGHRYGRGRGSDSEQAHEPEPPSSRQRYEKFRNELKDISDKRQEKRQEEAEERARREAEKAESGLTSLSRKDYFREYCHWLRPYRWRLVLIFFLAVGATGFTLVQPLFAKYIIDNILIADTLKSDEKIRLLLLAGGLMIGIIFIDQIINMIRNLQMTVVNSKLMVRIRRRLFQKMIRLSLSELNEIKTGGAISRLSNDVNNMGDLVMMGLITPSVSLLRLTGCLLIVMYLNWRLGIVAIALLPLMAVASYLWIRRIKPVWRAVNDDQAAISSRLSETFSGIRVVRAFQREHREEEVYTVGNHTVLRKSIFARLQIYLINFFWEIIMALSGALIVVVGGYLVIKGQASIGDIVAFQAYVFLVLNPIYMIMNTINQLQRSLASMERVMELINRPPAMPDHEDAKDAPFDIQTLEFKDVNFAYVKNTPVLSDINATFKGGESIALVGKSGAGKSTLTNLIARFYDPSEGSILINGIDLRDIKVDSYRNLLGVVQQDVFLFDGSIADNIRYGNQRASMDAVITAARQANAHDFIEGFEKGYDSFIGERGVKLSGGQRQRLSIARAFLSNPRILILDEATSNLDTESEQLIQASLSELMKGRTCFIIAHRLSTVRHCDRIMVIDDGKICETGNHKELMKKDGIYRSMVERQQETGI